MEGNMVMNLNLTAFEWQALWVILAVACVGLCYGALLIQQVLSQSQGSPAMQKVAKSIRQGAAAYLNRQFRSIALLIIIITVVLYVTELQNPVIAFGRAAAFLLGSIFSGLVGFIGMNLAVQGNVRTASAAESSFDKALRIAFRTGTIAGMLTVGLGLLGATIIFMIYQGEAGQVLVGFGFGGSLLALFMRVGGGIFTKAADVGADLVGKVEAGIPEDDPRNAAVIADNVGDNVGDCAGMAADIFESYEVTLVAAMILGYAAFPNSAVGVIFPLIVRAIGVVASIAGTYFVRATHGSKDAMQAINRGFLISALLSVVGFGYAAWAYVGGRPALIQFFSLENIGLKVFLSTFVGLLLAISISLLTEYFTSVKRAPVKEIAKATQTGSATTILSGIATGLESSVWAVLLISVAIVSALVIGQGNIMFSLYGISLCGMGMLTTTGVIVAMDTFGPVADNANGIIEMSGGNKLAQATVAELDAVGNTTKAITKGFAIGSAVIAAVSLFSSFIEAVSVGGIHGISIDKPHVFVGLLIGGAVPFLFSSLTIRAVGRGAFLVVKEVRRQFHEIKGIMEGTADPDYARCVDICTIAALRELIGPALLAILTPIIIGVLLQAEALGGFLAGTILTGQLLAVFMANSGGAWDNAKKAIEDGLYGGKGSDSHKAGVIGDTVGDPFKDTAGPALNPLIKVMNLVALLIAPVIAVQKTLTLPVVIGAMVAIGIIGYTIFMSKRELNEV